MPRVTAKEKILDSALRLFQQDGYLSTSVDEIIADAGVSKGSFYHAFKSKEMLGIEAIEHYLAHVISVLRDGDYHQVDDPLERVIAYIRHSESKADELWCDGCMMGNFTTDLARHHPSVRSKLKQLFTEMESQLVALFEPMVATIDCCALNAKQLARQYLSIIQGAILLGQAHKDIAVTKDCISSFRQLMESLRPH